MSGKQSQNFKQYFDFAGIHLLGNCDEALECVKLARKNSFTAVIWHRSGPTEDKLMAGLVAGTAVAQITGPACRGGDRSAAPGGSRMHRERKDSIG